MRSKWSRIQKILILHWIIACSIFPPGLGGAPLHAMPTVQRMTLSNGLVVLVAPEHSLPLVTFQLLMEAGSREDPPEKEGLAHLTARGLLLGTQDHPMPELNEALDFLGASLHVSPSRDYITVSLQVLKRNMADGFELFIEVLTQPTFPGEEIQRQKNETLGTIQSAEDDPMEIAEKRFREILFQENPYGHPVEGTKTSIPELSRGSVVRFYEARYHPNNAILSVVGDVSPEEVRKQLLPSLVEWSMEELPDATFAGGFAEGPKVEKMDREISQANIILGHKGVMRENPDYYALSVMNYILGGGGLGARLMEEIRIKRGLAYSVASFLDTGKYPGSFQIVVQTKNASAREAISIAKEQMERMTEEPVAEEELETAKKYLTGSFPLRLDSQAELAGFFTLVEYYGLGLDYAEQYPGLITPITRENVLRVAQTYLHPREIISVVVANLEEAWPGE